MRPWITAENADVIVAWATTAGVAAAFLAALVALWQLRLIRRDSRDRTRPYVQLDVVPGLHGSGSWDLVIENRGASAAFQVIADAGEIVPQDPDDHIAPVVGRYLLSPKTLVPGARRRVMWGYSNDKAGVRAGVLESRAVTVTYLDEHKRGSHWGKRHPYTATFVVGDAFALAVFPAPSEGDEPGDRDTLKSINFALRRLNTHVGELRR